MSNVYNRLGDETFTLSGTEYPFLFPDGGGHQGFVSANPFAPKQQVGERTYNDYTAYSVVAFTDLSGGMGQERIGEATKYHDSQNIDARSGELVLGPLLHTTTATGLNNFASPGTGYTLTTYNVGTSDNALAVALVGADKHIQRVWLPLVSLVDGKSVTVKLCQNGTLSEPGTVIATATLATDDLRTFGAWVCATFDTSSLLANGDTYWIVVYLEDNPYIVRPANALQWYAWYKAGEANYAAMVRNSSPTWENLYEYLPIFWACGEADVDSPPILIAGAAGDAVPRVWIASGRFLYYVGGDNLPVGIVNAAGDALYLMGASATCLALYKAEADLAPYLYIGQGDDVYVEKFNGAIGSETWTRPEVYAHAMCVHDDLLWLANTRNKVQGWNTTTLGNAVAVGDSTYIIRNMVSWNGYLWVGKDDGLYRVVIPDTYPTTGDLQAQKVIDYSPMASSDNFAAMVVHQGELFFSCNQGVMRYTTGGVLTPISPEMGLDMSADIRARCRCLTTTLGTMWAGFEGPFAGTSSLMAYNDGAWHPIANLARTGDMFRAILAEPGWYGSMPRLWFASGLCLSYVDMPLSTQRRWLWDEAEYAEEGYITLSWIDGGLRTVQKDWGSVQIDMQAMNEYTDNFEVTIYYRTTEQEAWIQTTTTDTSDYDGWGSQTGITTLQFPVNSHSTRIQMRVGLTRVRVQPTTTPTAYETPRVHAVILKYMERPDDIQQFTRTYELSSHQTWRNGVMVQDDLATRLGWIRTLRESAEPLTWVDWTGTTRTAHMVDYNAAENPEVRGDADTGTITITMRIQIV